MKFELVQFDLRITLVLNALGWSLSGFALSFISPDMHLYEYRFILFVGLVGLTIFCTRLISTGTLIVSIDDSQLSVHSALKVNHQPTTELRFLFSDLDDYSCENVWWDITRLRIIGKNGIRFTFFLRAAQNEKGELEHLADYLSTAVSTFYQSEIIRLHNSVSSATFESLVSSANPADNIKNDLSIIKTPRNTLRKSVYVLMLLFLLVVWLSVLIQPSSVQNIKYLVGVSIVIAVRTLWVFLGSR